MIADKLKILQVGRSFGSKSEDSLPYDLSKVLKDDGHKVGLFLSRVDDCKKNLSVSSGFHETLPMFQVYNNFSHVKSPSDFYVNETIDKHFSTFLDRFTPDVVHFHHLLGLSLGMVGECKKRDIPVFLSSQDFSMDSVLLKKFSNYLFQREHRSILNPSRVKQKAPTKNHISFSDDEVMMHPDSEVVLDKIDFERGGRVKFSLSLCPDVFEKAKGVVRCSLWVGKKNLFTRELDVMKLRNKQFFEITIDEAKRGPVILKAEAVEDCNYSNVVWGDFCVDRRSQGRSEKGVFKVFDKEYVQNDIELLKKKREFAKVEASLCKLPDESKEELEKSYLKSVKGKKRKYSKVNYPVLKKYKYKVSIVIPVCNGEDFLDEILTMIKQQKVGFSYEIVLVAAGANQATLDIIKNHKLGYHWVDRKDYNNGLTRNFGVSKSKGEIVVMLTADAIPKGSDWLANMIKHYDDKTVAAVYAKQIPRDNCNVVFAKRVNDSFTGSDELKINSIENFEQYSELSPFERYSLTNFDDVCSSFRRNFWEKNPYQEINFAEDLRFGVDVILAGHKIVYEPTAQVVHSHNRGVFYEYKRAYVNYLVLLDLYDFATITDLKTLFKSMFFTIKDNGRYVWGSGISFLKRIYYICFVVVLGVLTSFAQYEVYRDFQKGEIDDKGYKI
ncbi:glycosyltransferase [Candidatus Peregrinibacteria bacterium]|nr:glycosyltransferase [Candidatus Peregrinibacteria bacterium]